jgi:N-acetylneuraminic acid mutarotase
LASVAVSVNGAVYLFGGYTVAEDHSEKSIPHVWRIDGQNHQWTAMPPMPTPVDDTVALVYKNRYIYLVSGWHDVDNVDLVQVFDTETQTWQQASPYPLPPVFGHAGGIIGSRMLICDGVKVTWQAEKKQFLPSPECAIGSINADDVTKISWSKVLHHSGIAYYRMAAGADDRSKIYFVGGSDNPYNYDGIGYNGMSSKPSSDIRVFDTVTGKWQKIDSLIPETMDHRALLNTTKGFYILGGMSNNQKINNNIIKIKER